MQLKRVVITGIGTINSLGYNVPQYFDNLIAGTSGAGLITRFDAQKFKTRFACEIKGYDPEKFGIEKEKPAGTIRLPNMLSLQQTRRLKTVAWIWMR